MNKFIQQVKDSNEQYYEENIEYIWEEMLSPEYYSLMNYVKKYITKNA